MQLHGNARTTPYQRREIARRVLEQAEPAKDTALALGVSERTIYKWLRRYREEGEAGLQDRCSRPRQCPNQTPPAVVYRILRLRRRRLTAWDIAQRLQIPRSTVSRVLCRHGLSRLHMLEPKPPVVRYERKRPGELLHLDTKKLARIVRPGHRIHGDRSRKADGAGWENAHVAVDDHSRLAYVEVLHNEGKLTCTDFLIRAVQFYRKHGVVIERVMTDNGPGYRSRLFNRTCRRLQIRHIYTRPYTPQTNGKAERFIQTLKQRWAYACCYRDSARRTRALKPWLNGYNHHRPHAGIGNRPPISRIRTSREQPL
jgi:transposase InsO family protein|tara:strand:- start:18 stop:956 length:939 start_codon:yes stop_codon:yes gene_type:complete